MTIWTPTLQDNTPRYLALADALARDLATGRLRPGDRLPTHRELADLLGVTIGTISRGYAEAERRGLTVGEIGRGTFVRKQAGDDPWPRSPERASTVDFTLSLPVALPMERDLLAATLRELADEPDVNELLLYRPESADARQRQRAAAWLQRLGLAATPENLLVTAGSQHALNVVLSAVLGSGQVLLTEALTYPSMKSQARQYGVKLRAVAVDEGGLVPESLAQACLQEPRPKALYLIPSMHNPTTVTLSPQRREAVAALVTQHDLLLIEDDIFSFMMPDPPEPLAVRIPERAIYLSSVAKCLAPGLRTGFMMVPPPLRTRLLAAIHNTVWMAAPLMVEVATRWLADGTADRIIAAKREETQARQRLAAQILAPWTFAADPNGTHLWLTLPEPWSSDEFTARARECGVMVVGGGAFAVNRRDTPHAVRVSLGLPDRATLKCGLATIAEILSGTAGPNY
ncbi:aminotransferase-like domain-containing protein [Acanthopleuribacter pedis]|uniref:PLP-dependent aminotransferase family protein n=1 Tax=Acanthopleuribacter pedis TaxID=442870 RepID=A0A8J7Q153_9BACT|nr:PLP-dependent aminotransferase family protein [Acanthopleuribacter pedis]MBO1318502.1 PLP-dependent aminotransferase family protein [Acanthopleuribacter pedis]